MNRLFPVAVSMSAFSIMVLLFAGYPTTNPADDDYTAGYEDGYAKDSTYWEGYADRYDTDPPDGPILYSGNEILHIDLSFL